VENEKLLQQYDLKINALCELIARYRTARDRKNGEYYFIIADNLNPLICELHKLGRKIAKQEEK